MQVNSINILMNFKEFVYEKLLLEANKEKRVAYLTEKYGKKLKELLENNSIDPRNYSQTGNMVTLVVERIDPTEGEYSEWIIKHILTIQDERKLRRFFDEDFWAVQEELTKYHKYKKLFKRASTEMNNPNTAKLSDINQIKGFNDLHEKLQLIEHYIEKEEEKDELKNAEKDVVKIYNSENYLILSPKTVEASCAYGRNTRWCTAAQNHNYFEQYNKQGPLYIIIDKKKNKKYQFHFQSGQYMNENDDDITMKLFLYENQEIRNSIFELAKSNKNDDFILLADKGADWLAENIKNDSHQTLTKYIKNYAIIALKQGVKDPELVNKAQRLFIFQDDGTISVNTFAKSFSELTNFIHEDDRTAANDILEGNYGYYTQGVLEMKIDDFQYDWLDQSSIQLLRKYIYNAYNKDLVDVYDMKEFLEQVEDGEIEELLALSYTSACENELSDLYTKRVIDTIIHNISPINKKYISNTNEEIIFTKFTEKTINDIIYEVNPAVAAYSDFIVQWAEHAQEYQDLKELHLDNISYDPEREKYGKVFNVYFQENIENIIPTSQQMELDLSGINRDMTTNFDAFIKKIFQEGLGGMGEGGLSKRGGTGTTPIANSTSSTTPKQVTGGVTMKHATGKVNVPNPTGGTPIQKPMDYGAILNDPTAFELFQSDPQNIEGFKQHLSDPKNFTTLQQSIKDPKASANFAQLLASLQQ